MNEFSTSRLVLLVEYAGLNSSEPPLSALLPGFLYGAGVGGAVRPRWSSSNLPDLFHYLQAG